MWKTIDTLPDEYKDGAGKVALMWDPIWGEVLIGYYSGTMFFVYGEPMITDNFQPTHWMPLPEPPE